MLQEKQVLGTENFDKTYDLMKQVMLETEEKEYASNRRLKKEFHQHCSKSKQVEELIEDELAHHHAHLTLKKKSRTAGVLLPNSF